MLAFAAFVTADYCLLAAVTASACMCNHQLIIYIFWPLLLAVMALVTAACYLFAYVTAN